MRAFTYRGSSAQIIFGAGRSGEVGGWVDKLGCRRALVLSTPSRREQAGAIARSLGDRAAGLFDGAAMHTPVEVTHRAMSIVAETGADCVVAYGGGSTIGLGKAIAFRTDLPQIVVPTTYAGSEATSILGQTENGVKTTVRDARVLPEVVIYDPELSLALPVGMSVTSGLNAMAHAAEALYAEDRSPISTLMATAGLRAMREALPRIVSEPGDRAARAGALYGAWLCGTVLGAVAMGLHHKICHTLGGSFDLPHAETHAAMLPHTIGFNAETEPELLSPIATLLGGSPGLALFSFARSLGAPLALRALGFARDDIAKAAKIATQTLYPNPRPIDNAAISAILERACDGEPPPS